MEYEAAEVFVWTTLHNKATAIHSQPSGQIQLSFELQWILFRNC